MMFGLVATIALLLTGCKTIPQAPIVINKELITQSDNRVGLYFETEAPTTHIYGASCLLCYGVASAANSSLSSHLEGIAIDDVQQLKNIVEESLKAQGKTIEVVVLPKRIKKLPKFKSQPNFPKRDFRKLQERLKLDTLIVIHIPEHGAYRSYSAYIPNGGPVGTVRGEIYTVDLNTNKYIQYKKIDIKVSSSGNWDEPPSFPGVTNAYYAAIEKAKEFVAELF